MVYYRPDVEKFARSVVATLTSSPMAVPNTSQSDFGDSSLSVHYSLVGRNKECKGTRDPTLRYTPSNGPHPPPPLSNKEHRSSPHCTVANSESKILHRFNGRVGWQTLATPPGPLPPLLCMPCVCCSLICFSTPLRTVDCVQYNSVLWPTLASLLLLQSSDFTASARKWRQWAPPPTAPQLLLCTPTTPLR